MPAQNAIRPEQLLHQVGPKHPMAGTNCGFGAALASERLK